MYVYVMYALHVQKTELTKKKFTTQHSSITSSYTRTRSEKVQISGIIKYKLKSRLYIYYDLRVFVYIYSLGIIYTCMYKL